MARSPYLRWEPHRIVASLLAGAVLVPVVAVVAKTLVEGLTRFSYTIHWLETVPVLVLLVAFVINGAWNERADQEREG